MSRQTLLENISQALQAFASGHLAAGSLEKNALALFETLGYPTRRRIEGLHLSAQNLAQTFNSAHNLRPDKALTKDWKSIHLLFQLTDDEVSAAGRQPQMHMIFDSRSKLDPAIYQSYLFFALDLDRPSYTRSELATLTR